jgi:hypothetical protein
MGPRLNATFTEKLGITVLLMTLTLSACAGNKENFKASPTPTPLTPPNGITLKWDEDNCDSVFEKLNMPIPPMLMYVPEVFDGIFKAERIFSVNGLNFGIIVPQNEDENLTYHPSIEELDAIEEAIVSALNYMPDYLIDPATSPFVTVAGEQDGQKVQFIPIIDSLEQTEYPWESGEYYSHGACVINNGNYPQGKVNTKNLIPNASRIITLLPSQYDAAQLGTNFPIFQKFVATHEFIHVMQTFFRFLSDSPGYSLPYGMESFATWFALKQYPETHELLPSFVSNFYNLLTWRNYSNLFQRPDNPEFFPGPGKDYSNFIFWETIFELSRKNQPDLPEDVLFKQIVDLYFRIGYRFDAEADTIIELGSVNKEYANFMIQNIIMEEVSKLFPGISADTMLNAIQAQGTYMVLDPTHWIQKFVSQNDRPYVLEKDFSGNLVTVGYEDLKVPGTIFEEREAVVHITLPMGISSQYQVKIENIDYPWKEGYSNITAYYYALIVPANGIPTILFPEEIPSTGDRSVTLNFTANPEDQMFIYLMPTQGHNVFDTDPGPLVEITLQK